MKVDNLLYKKAVSRVKFVARNSVGNYLENAPVYVFHHIPKCGGTSLVYALREWFWVVKDYRSPESKKVNLNLLRKCHCLVGHFHFDGIHLNQRYPEFFETDRFRLFTFLRDPLQTRISLYYYEAKMGKKHELTLEEDLMTRPNFLASCFPCNENNFKQVLDRYFFIGVLEEKQTSLKKLAKLIDRQNFQFPHYNVSEKNKEAYKISDEISSLFRKSNQLDYAIYEYALERFNNI